jgi:hypothetical protein
LASQPPCPLMRSQIFSRFLVIFFPDLSRHDSKERERSCSDQGPSRKNYSFDIVGNPNPSLRRSTSQRLFVLDGLDHEKIPTQRRIFFFSTNIIFKHELTVAPEKKKKIAWLPLESRPAYVRVKTVGIQPNRNGQTRIVYTKEKKKESESSI